MPIASGWQDELETWWGFSFEDEPYHHDAFYADEWRSQIVFLRDNWLKTENRKDPQAADAPISSTAVFFVRELSPEGEFLYVDGHGWLGVLKDDEAVKALETLTASP